MDAQQSYEISIQVQAVGHILGRAWHTLNMMSYGVKRFADNNEIYFTYTFSQDDDLEDLIVACGTKYN